MSPPGHALRGLIWGGLGLVLAFVVAAGTWNLLQGTTARQAADGRPGAGVLEGPDDFGAVDPFTLTERSGRTVTLEDLSGSWWIADFIFTRCTGICPILTTRMASLGRRLPELPAGENVRFVSFTVDPDWDTPEVLDAYARQAAAGGADLGRWLFLTGPRDVMYRLIGESFRLNVAERGDEPAAEGELITHSDRFVLVDPEGRIRGYYHGTDEESVARLVQDLESLRH